MRKSIAATAIIAAAAATASCGFHRGGDSGPTVSRDYPVGAFQKIEVAGPYDVEVRTGSNPSVAGKGSEKLLEQTRVEVHGDTLSISPEKPQGLVPHGLAFAARRTSSSPCRSFAPRPSPGRAASRSTG